ncbi:MAG: hypothetical protein COA53_07565 [Rhodobacteraceae bacterium]|nr:MAG: hypothetical protein COA53_07565 [Paracoccaceae bacterium]
MKRYSQSSISAIASRVLMMLGIVVTIGTIVFPASSKGNSSENSAERSSKTSSLGALNAAHTNAAAQANAAAQSRDGLIALYKSTVMASAGFAKQIEEAQATYNEYVATKEAAGYASAYKTYNEYLRANPAPSENDILHWETLNSLQVKIDEATAEAAKAKALESEVLELAANKETGDEVIAALWDLLDF